MKCIVYFFQFAFRKPIENIFNFKFMPKFFSTQKKRKEIRTWFLIHISNAPSMCSQCNRELIWKKHTTLLLCIDESNKGQRVQANTVAYQAITTTCVENTTKIIFKLLLFINLKSSVNQFAFNDYSNEKILAISF